MQISQRIISASAPVAPVVWAALKAAKQSSPPSAWQIHKKAEQILELRQQIETTDANDKCRVNNLKRKLKQLERRQALVDQSSTLDPEASTWSPSAASPIITICSTLNPAASEWKPLTTPIAEPRIVRFEVPVPTNYDRRQDNRWGSGGLNPYTVKLLGSELLNAINELGDSFQAADKFVPIDDDEDDDGDSHFFFVPDSPPPASFVDSGYGSSS